MVYSFRLQATIVGKSRQELEAAHHITTSVKRRENAHMRTSTQPPSYSFAVCDPPSGDGAAHGGLVSPHLN